MWVGLVVAGVTTVGAGAALPLQGVSVLRAAAVGVLLGLIQELVVPWSKGGAPCSLVGDKEGVVWDEAAPGVLVGVGCPVLPAGGVARWPGGLGLAARVLEAKEAESFMLGLELLVCNWAWSLLRDGKFRRLMLLGENGAGSTDNDEGDL